MAFQIYDPMSGFRAGLTSSEQLAQSIQQQRERKMLEPYIVPGAQAKLAQQAAQTKYLGAQTQRALAQAKSPLGGQTLTGTAGEAMSTMSYHKIYGDNPYAMSVLKNAQDRKQAMANSRYLNAIPAAERQQMVAVFKAHNIDPLAAVHLISQGYSEQQILNMKSQADVAHQQVAPQVPPQVQPQQTGQPIVPQQGGPQQTSLQQPPIQPGMQPGAQPSADVVSPTSGQVVTPQHIMGAMTQAAPGAPTWQTTQGMYAPQPAALTRAQEAAQGAAGLDYLGDYIAKSIKYGGITAKVTRPWLRDAYSKDPAKVNKALDYYSAQAIKPELALYRMRIIGGMPSARAMAYMTPAVMGHVSVDSANTPASFQQKLMVRVNEKLNESALAMQKQTLSRTPTIYEPKTSIAQGIVQVQAPKYSQEDLEFTAKKYGISVAEVKQRLGAK